MTQEEKLKTEERIVEVLKTVYDPEIPVDIYNLGLVYRIDLHDDATLDVDMTLTAPNCPAAHRRRERGEGEPRFRTRLGQRHDERGGQARAGLPLNRPN